jgi:hypothetical protein
MINDEKRVDAPCWVHHLIYFGPHAPPRLVQESMLLLLMKNDIPEILAEFDFG